MCVPYIASLPALAKAGLVGWCMPVVEVSVSVARAWLWTVLAAAEATVGQAFAAQPLCGKAAYAVVGCTDLLLGARAADVDVADAVKLYGFDRPALIARVLRLAAALGLRQDAFVVALAEEPDYEHQVRHAIRLFTCPTGGPSLSRSCTCCCTTCGDACAACVPAPRVSSACIMMDCNGICSALEGRMGLGKSGLA